MHLHAVIQWQACPLTHGPLQVAWVVNLAQPVLAMHAWRSLWVIAKTAAACLRDPKLLLHNLRCRTV